MTDYAGEQEMEIEALEAILMEQMTVLEPSSADDWPDTSTSYRIEIRSDEEIAEGTYEKKLDLVFAHTANYPDEPPLYRLSNIQGLTEEERLEVSKLVDQQIQDNLGMAMIYTLVDLLKDWLVNQMATISKETDFELSSDELKKREKEEEERKLAEARALGTAVTTQTFADWKRKFDAEKTAEKAQINPEMVNREKGLTGKQFFMSQDTSSQAVRTTMDENDSEGTDFDEEFYDDDDEEEDEGDDDLDEDELLDQIIAQKTQQVGS